MPGRRVVGAVMTLVVLAAAGLVWSHTPDTGPPLATGAVGRTAPAPTGVGRVPRSPEGPVAGQRRPSALPPIDPARTYPAESKGLTEAIVARRDRLGSCWSAFLARAPDPPLGRFTLELTLEGDGRTSTLATEVVNDDADDALADCAAEALADARFGPVTGIQRLLLPVPVATAE